MDINNEFIRDWKKLGDENSKDPINQFFYYFVAFNCLYENVYVDLHPKPEDRENKHDREKISDFRNSYIYTACKNKGFNPCENLEKIPFLAKGVEDADKKPFNSRHMINKWDNIKLQEANLFNNIYQVRCNLFHGRKYVLDQEGRDFGLIKECAYVLEQLLSAYLLDVEISSQA